MTTPPIASRFTCSARRIGAAALAALACSLACAQNKPAVSDEDLARTRKEMQEQMRQLNSESIEAARKKYIEPQKNGSRAEALNANRPVMPKVDALAKPGSVANVDIGALAQKLAEGKTDQVIPGFVADMGPKLRIFVTMALPAETLKALMSQAEAAGATLVLRGMVNGSLKETAFAVRNLRGKRKVNVSIDPEAFDRYGVTHAPAFVLTKATTPSTTPTCAGKVCAQPDSFALVTGDVSLEYALEKLEQRAPQFKPEARVFLKKIRG